MSLRVPVVWSCCCQTQCDAIRRGACLGWGQITVHFLFGMYVAIIDSWKRKWSCNRIQGRVCLRVNLLQSFTSLHLWLTDVDDKKTTRKVKLNKCSTTIGRKSSVPVDFVVGGSRVSRKHAMVFHGHPKDANVSATVMHAWCGGTDPNANATSLPKPRLSPV